MTSSSVGEWLESAAMAELGLSTEDDEEDELDDLYLHYAEGERLTFLLRSWQAYRSRGVLPFTGGLADQPRALFHDFEQLNTRYIPILNRLLREKYPDRQQGKTTEGETLDALFYTDENTVDWRTTLRD